MPRYGRIHLLTHPDALASMFASRTAFGLHQVTDY
jgi:hypothetical protein